MKINKILIIVLIILVAITVGLYFVYKNKKNEASEFKSVNETSQPTESRLVSESNSTNKSSFANESKSVSKSSFDNDYEYVVITDYRYATMMNDGGSYTDLYYEIDLEENTIEEKVDNYDKSLSKSEQEREKNSTKGKLIEKIDLNQTYNDRLQKLFDSILKSTDTTEREKLDKFKSYYLLNNEKEIIMTEEEKDEFVDIISELKNNK